ncbi:MAG: hypothetical protein FJZ16_03145 [Candidatus Omnitrophica bacterium]|nr:hypothetical protein [Candidatus Omnitrophota bacterium]
MDRFILILKGYLIEILPALALGFFLSGLIHEFVPSAWVEKNLGNKGLKAIFYSTITGTILPICCWGALPVAVSFYKKGSRLGPILAFLVATPATSVSALIVTYRLLGLKFTVFLFFAVIVMGMFIGIIGNKIPFRVKENEKEICLHCKELSPHIHKKGFLKRMQFVFKFAFWDMPKEIGLETLLGIVLAAIVATFIPLGVWIKRNLWGVYGYIFSLVFGLIIYICSTATVPLVDVLIKQGMNVGAGMVLLLVGPITSYGTILVLKKEFGTKILLIYLIFISLSSLILGYLYSLL